MDTAGGAECWCGGRPDAVVATFDLGADGVACLRRCPRCGTLALLPQQSEAVLQRWYDADYYGAREQKFVGPVARLVARYQDGRSRLAARHLPRGGRVLDVGCGNGGFLAAMRQRGYEAEGTEWSAASAARVPEGLRVHVGDLLALDLPDASFDLVTLWHVFEHVRSPEATLRRIHRLLRPGGALLLTLPNIESWQARVFRRHWFHHDPPRHLFGFGPEGLTALLRRTGFVVGRTRTWSLEQNPYGVIQSTLNAAGFPRDRAYDVLKGLRPGGPPARLLDLTLLAALTPPALVFATLEWMAGRGGTMLLSTRTAGG